MKEDLRTRWKRRWKGNWRGPEVGKEELGRAELLSADMLAQHARHLAQRHQVGTGRRANPLLTRLRDHERALRDFQQATLEVARERPLTPAAEWLLDNYYLTEQQIQLARQHLPRGYSAELPCLRGGGAAGLPRVFDLVREFISHVDAQVDPALLCAFVAAYQEKTTLRLGELWAVPIMLRLGLIENLQRVSARLVIARAQAKLADRWVDRLQQVAEQNPARMVIVVAEMAQADLPMTSPFVAKFSQRLSRQSPAVNLARSWLEQRLAESGLSIELLVQQETRHQAEDQVTVSQSIASLRNLSAMDWKAFVEPLSRVEAVLRQDPAGVYAAMEFGTRDAYRHAVEALARHSPASEEQVARAALAMAEAAANTLGREDRTAHVGFHLIEAGAAALGQRVRVRWPLRTRLGLAIRRWPLGWYLGGVASIMVVVACLLSAAGVGQGLPLMIQVLLLGPILLAASQLGVAIMDRWSTGLIRPPLLPRMDFSAGLPAASQTLVVIPSMLTDPEEVDRLVGTLELHRLANQDPNVQYALLTDFADADTEYREADATLLERASTGIRDLNRKYAGESSGGFLLLHRPRQWNPGEGVWMGWERKRGKLADLNARLRSAAPGPFSAEVGEVNRLATVRYVITLDADTQLPRESVHRLVGTMAHVLNRPVVDELRGAVTAGYGILQPRVSISLPSAVRSWFSRALAGEAGVDPYTRAVSNVYQDLFGEGSFIGKGIYDVDAFVRAVRPHLPVGTVLSHDLLEGCLARCGLVSDLELYEAQPSCFYVEAARRHRWVRGDWQTAPWLRSQVRGKQGRKEPNPLSLLSQWKIFDNLRRSLVPPALLALVVAGMILPGAAAGLVLLVLTVLALPGLLAVAGECMTKPADVPWTAQGRLLMATAGRQALQLLLALVFLPYEAGLHLDAAVRTGWRMAVSRRQLLQWTTSSEAEAKARTTLLGSYRTMGLAPGAAIVAGLLATGWQPTSWLWLGPWCAGWLAAPALAWWISQPRTQAPPRLSVRQVRFLRTTARRHWHYFETFVTAEHNWLAPDNFQEVPTPLVAERTSPTNLGMALLANLAAVDLGYLSAGAFLQRTEDALCAMDGLERYRGHFYNWYDTRTAKPMLPLYVSSVDSGNLAGHLLTLAAGLREGRGAPIWSPEVLEGTRDTVAVIRGVGGDPEATAALEAILASEPTTLAEALGLMRRAEARADAWLAALPAEMAESQAREWVVALRADCAGHRAELEALAPWLGDGKEAGPDPAGWPIGATGLPTLCELAELGRVNHLGAEDAPQSQHLSEAGRRARARIDWAEALASRCEQLAAMDFAFLLNPARELFVTGFNVAERRYDTGHYDLLASEARLGSYVAVSLGQVGQDHWFSLGRQLVLAQGQPILASWSGSMFEYLMPMLVMPSYAGSLLDQTARSFVQLQIAYGEARGVPWGISESGYHRTDAHFNYQYRAFGVPGIGLKRGLGEDLVIAPYATCLALMVAPEAACANLERLAKEGRLGNYGFYEAIDYTPSRLPPEVSSVLIQSFMVHHQGMSLLALLHLLRQQPMTRRFLASPVLQASRLLLQERVPKTVAKVLLEDLNLEFNREAAAALEGGMRILDHPTPAEPEVHLLSNGRYHVVIGSGGGGYSRWRDLAVTRWREDATCDPWGTFVYLRDLASGEVCSAAFQPTGQPSRTYEAIFTQARAEFRQCRKGLEIHLSICVSPEDDVELRRLRLTNLGNVSRELELTSYAEVVMASSASEAAHPAFSNLFVQTEWVAEGSALLVTRRSRSATERPPFLLHTMAGAGALSGETDRVRFLGRGGSTARPAALRESGPLSNTVGSVLDPIVALRRTVIVPPQGSVTVDFAFGVTEEREAALVLIEKYQSSRMVDRAFELAWTHAQVALRQLDVSELEAQQFGRLAGSLIFADPVRRAARAVLRANRRGQSGLWSFGISGDLPIILLRISDPGRIDLVRQLIHAHSFWRLKGLAVELVVLNEDSSSYRQSLHDEILNLLASGIEAQMVDQPGGIFVRHLEQVCEEDRVLLQSVARLSLDDGEVSLGTLLERRRQPDLAVPAFVPSRSGAAQLVPGDAPPAPPPDLIFANGIGGFTPDGREYIITLQPGQHAPAPWVNVIANPTFGTLVSEVGSSYTWVENAHDYRLTPWSNDPVGDPPGEAFYLRDEHTGQVWSPTPQPVRGATAYVIRHGFGYTVYEHTEFGIVSELTVFVAMDAPVKFMVLKVRNVSGHERRLSVTGYWEWVLGDQRAKTLMHVQTEVDSKTGALLARNRYSSEFSERIAFIEVNDSARTVTGDRREFIGRHGRLGKPAALGRVRLSGQVGASLDPCGAVQVTFGLAPGQERETVFRLGVGRNVPDVQSLIHRFRRPGAAQRVLEGVWEYWNRTLGTIHVQTPDPAVNVMANGWLLYQTLSCRLWGRTGFYQSGGAYGFRDQLQDTMALVHAEPALTREHLLRAASRQFWEGDVQHWWHPPAGRGVRTQFADDFLWLPFAVCRYLQAVGDTGVLDEQVGFLQGRALKPQEEAYYELPERAEGTDSLYQHCVRAIEHGLKFGAHGLPLMGCGDWNDGMNRVGHEGRGESVWLGFFLHTVLTQFAAVARTRRDDALADRWLDVAQQLQLNLEEHGWDGEWYRRAYFDDGQPLGSQMNRECQIDSLPQSWAVLSGAADPARARIAMAAAMRRLLRPQARLMQLFDPPFDRSDLDPGYIKGYIPGVRENGGQYTHAAIWMAIALARQGDPEQAWALFHLLNPVNHGSTPEQIATYKVEPYVVAADVYALAPHTGRGGWSWYTGSASWLYRLLVETLLGIHREVDHLRLEPCLPAAWPSYVVHYRYYGTVYHLTIARRAASPAGPLDTGTRLTVDGRVLPGCRVPLRDDHREHQVEFVVP